jgi:hypothetical protein
MEAYPCKNKGAHERCLQYRLFSLAKFLGEYLMMYIWLSPLASWCLCTLCVAHRSNYIFSRAQNQSSISCSFSYLLLTQSYQALYPYGEFLFHANTLSARAFELQSSR